MKIVMFTDNRAILSVIENVTNAQPRGKNEVIFDQGQIFGLSDRNYCILEDDQNFEDLTEEQIQQLLQAQEGTEPVSETDQLRGELAATQAVLNDILLGGMML